MGGVILQNRVGNRSDDELQSDGDAQQLIQKHVLHLHNGGGIGAVAGEESGLAAKRIVTDLRYGTSISAVISGSSQCDGAPTC